MAVLEAARALQKLGVKPKRTIRFVLFTGEEQGLNGSKAYVKAHQNELGKISGVLVHDSGTGKGSDDRAHGELQRARDDRPRAISIGERRGFRGADFANGGRERSRAVRRRGRAGILVRAGGRGLRQDAPFPGGHAGPRALDDLTEGAQVLAVFAYNVAQLPEMLPRKPAKQGGN